MNIFADIIDRNETFVNESESRCVLVHIIVVKTVAQSVRYLPAHML